MTPASDPRRPARPVERALPPPAPDTAFESGLYLPLDQIEIAVTGGAAAVLNGNLAVSWVDSTFDGALDADDQLESARAGVALRGAATLELALDAGADVAGLLRLAMIPLPPIAAGPSIEISPCTAAEWRRLPDHTTRALAPTAVPATLDVDAEVELQTNPATAFGELLTD